MVSTQLLLHASHLACSDRLCLRAGAVVGDGGGARIQPADVRSAGIRKPARSVSAGAREDAGRQTGFDGNVRGCRCSRSVGPFASRTDARPVSLLGEGPWAVILSGTESVDVSQRDDLLRHIASDVKLGRNVTIRAFVNLYGCE